MRSICAVLWLGLAMFGASCKSTTQDDGVAGDTVPHGYVLATARCELGSMDGEGCSCDELWPDGPRFCASYESEEQQCRDVALDECCSHADCDQGFCQYGFTVPFCCGEDDCADGMFCNWPPPGAGGAGWCVAEAGESPGRNRCVVDECSSDADCPTGHCETIGLVRECVEGTCRTDADCTMRPGGGRCELVSLGCCAGQAWRGPQTTCVYADDGCTGNIDCPDGSHCDIRDGFAACRRGSCAGD